MYRIIFITFIFSMVSAFIPNFKYYKSNINHMIMQAGKGFGGGESTRDPLPTSYDPNDPKGKQTAIFKAETFAEYMAKRNGLNTQLPTEQKISYVPTVKADSVPTVNSNSDNVKKTETYSEYIARRDGLNSREIKANYVINTEPYPKYTTNHDSLSSSKVKEHIAPSVQTVKSDTVKKTETYAEYIARRDGLTTNTANPKIYPSATSIKPTITKNAETYAEYMPKRKSKYLN